MEHPAFEAGITVMDLCFNELSVSPIASDKFEAARIMMIFAETARIARQRKIRNIKTDLYTSDIILSPGYSMHDWLFGGDFSKSNRNYRDFLIGMIRPPFIPEEREDAYLSAAYHFEDSENNIKKTECQGLAAAYISNTLSISLQNGLSWSKLELTILIERQNGSRDPPYTLRVKTTGSCYPEARRIAELLEKEFS
jgi:hypothetical protein